MKVKIKIIGISLAIILIIVGVALLAGPVDLNGFGSGTLLSAWEDIPDESAYLVYFDGNQQATNQLVWDVDGRSQTKHDYRSTIIPLTDSHETLFQKSYFKIKAGTETVSFNIDYNYGSSVGGALFENIQLNNVEINNVNPDNPVIVRINSFDPEPFHLGMGCRGTGSSIMPHWSGQSPIIDLYDEDYSDAPIARVQINYPKDSRYCIKPYHWNSLGTMQIWFLDCAVEPPSSNEIEFRECSAGLPPGNVLTTYKAVAGTNISLETFYNPNYFSKAWPPMYVTQGQAARELDTQILKDIVDGKTLTVPAGEIWEIRYARLAGGNETGFADQCSGSFDEITGICTVSPTTGINCNRDCDPSPGFWSENLQECVCQLEHGAGCKLVNDETSEEYEIGIYDETLESCIAKESDICMEGYDREGRNCSMEINLNVALPYYEFCNSTNCMYQPDDECDSLDNSYDPQRCNCYQRGDYVSPDARFCIHVPTADEVCPEDQKLDLGPAVCSYLTDIPQWVIDLLEKDVETAFNPTWRHGESREEQCRLAGGIYDPTEVYVCHKTPLKENIVCPPGTTADPLDETKCYYEIQEPELKVEKLPAQFTDTTSNPNEAAGFASMIVGLGLLLASLRWF